MEPFQRMSAALGSNQRWINPQVPYACAYQILLVRCSPLLLMVTSPAHRVYRNRVPNKYTALDFFVADAGSLSGIVRLVSFGVFLPLEIVPGTLDPVLLPFVAHIGKARARAARLPPKGWHGES